MTNLPQIPGVSQVTLPDAHSIDIKPGNGDSVRLRLMHRSETLQEMTLTRRQLADLIAAGSGALMHAAY